ncbi:MAG TPA: hypothetical protein VM434_00600 [Beijerinckiaceae bacterium]|nr:hypothetical protein [Beijerinckiaceae bacterium]
MNRRSFFGFLAAAPVAAAVAKPAAPVPPLPEVLIQVKGAEVYDIRAMEEWAAAFRRGLPALIEDGKRRGLYHERSVV